MKSQKSPVGKIILIVVLILAAAFSRTAVHTVMDHFFKPSPPAQSQSQQTDPMLEEQIKQAEKEYAAQLEAVKKAEAERQQQIPALVEAEEANGQ